MSVVIDGSLGITTPAETVQGALTTTGNTILGDASTDTLTVGVDGIVKDASGNVGIGTASPGRRLDVSAATGLIGVTSSTGTNYVAFQALNTSGTMTLGLEGSSPVVFFGATAYSAIFGTGGAYSLHLATNNTVQATITAAGLLQFNSGYGSVATAYGCRAWVNFNGTGTVAIRASGNVSSITDSGVGTYAINLTTAMPDVNGAIVSGKTNQTSNAANATGVGWDSTSAIGVVVYEAGVKVDASNLYFSAFR